MVLPAWKLIPAKLKSNNPTSVPMQEITLTLSVKEVNQILEALGNQPFNQVFALIGKIQQQASSQVSATNGDEPLNSPTDG